MPIFATDLFPPEIEAARTQIEARLDSLTRFDADCPDHLKEAIRYSLLAPGKRLRPLMVLMASQACGGTIENALPAACAVEMIHAYSLVHDDLPAMDDDDLRRGQPTCHVKFGEAVAILVGDALIAKAFEVLAQEIPSAEHAVQCVKILGHAASASQLVGGQADDLAGENEALPIEQLERIHRRKTAALFEASLKMGGVLGGGDENRVQRLGFFGQRLGLAFQIIDDLLDLKGNQVKMGKRTQRDGERGKSTYPALLGEAPSQRRAEDLIAEALQEIEPFGASADPLRRLARFVTSRNQ